MNNLPENEKDFNERVEAMSKEMTPIMAKYELALGAQPRIEHGAIVADVVFMSSRKKEEKKEETPLSE